MTTGAMTGADAPALRALAAQLSQSAGRLDGIRSGIRGRLYSVQWDGPDGADFRAAWDGRHVPLLAGVAEGLRDAAERLLAEADQQEAASGAAGGGLTIGPAAGPTIGPATGPLRPADDGDGLVDRFGDAVGDVSLVVGGAGAFLGSMLEGYGVHVPSYLRNGTLVSDYWRWSAGHAGSLNDWMGSAGSVARADALLDRTGNVLSVVGAGATALGQWDDDAGKGYSDGERATRAAFAAGTSTVVGIASERALMWGGAALGTAICPGVGTVIGGAIGWAVANGVTTYFGDEINEFGATAGSAVYDAGEAVVDFGGDVLDAGGDLLDDVGDGAEDLWHDLTPW